MSTHQDIRMVSPSERSPPKKIKRSTTKRHSDKHVEGATIWDHHVANDQHVSGFSLHFPCERVFAATSPGLAPFQPRPADTQRSSGAAHTDDGSCGVWGVRGGGAQGHQVGSCSFDRVLSRSQTLESKGAKK